MKELLQHNLGGNRIKTLFTAIFNTSKVFVVLQVFVAALLLVSLTLVRGDLENVFAKNAKRLAPDEVEIRVFPSDVTSDSWSNTRTLTSHDLSEDALLQNFNTANSMFLDIDGEYREAETAVPSVTVPPDDAASDGGDTATASSSESEPTTTVEETESTPEDTEASEDTPSVDPEPAVDEEPPAADESEPEPEAGVEESTEVSAMSNDTWVPYLVTNYIVNPFRMVLGQATETLAQADTDVVSDPEPDTEPVTDEPTAAEEVVPEPITEPVPAAEESAPTPESEPALETEQVVEDVIPDTATTSASSTGNSEGVSVASSTADTASTTASSTPQTEPVVDIESDHFVTLTGFGVPELASGQFVENLQFRVSLAGRTDVSEDEPLPALTVQYSFGSFSGEAGSIILDEEVSNALNGGYYLIPFPSIADPALLADLEITLGIAGDIELIEDLYIDAAWLEVNTVVYDNDLLKKRSSLEEMLKHLKGTEKLTFMSDQIDFTREELPQFNFKYESQRNFIVQAFRSVFSDTLAEVQSVSFVHKNAGVIGISPEINITNDGLISVYLTEADKEMLKPGTYTVEVEIAEGGHVSTDSFEFQWGLLSINPNQTEYEVGDPVKISMGALSPNGNTVCDAQLNLFITDPRGFISNEPVIESGQCFGNNVTDIPDYMAEFPVGKTGLYELYLERLDEQGNVIAHTATTFEVVQQQTIAIERTGPTRIFPPAPYAMELTVHAKDGSFDGEIIERVPSSFVIKETDAEVRRKSEYTELVWETTVRNGESKTVSYEFDAPDLSPYLFELGPARLVNIEEREIVEEVAIPEQFEDSLASSTEEVSASTTDPVVSYVTSTSSVETVVFSEHRQWQIASDATGNMILFWDGAGAIPTGWICLSCGSGTFYQRFVQGGASYNTTGGAATHTHTASGAVAPSPSAVTESTAVDDIAPTNHTHTYTPTIGSASNLPTYRQLRVIQYTAGAGEPLTIPAGAIGVFDVASSSLPSGWTRYSAQDGAYIRAEDTPGSTGGSNTHTHTIGGITSNAAGTATRNRNGGSQQSAALLTHSHSVTANTGSVNNEPPYIEVLLAKLGSDSAAPNDLIAMWTDEVPEGWLDVSSTGSDPFNGRFIKPATTYGATGGGSTHSHADVTGITSSGPSAVDNARASGNGSGGTHTHSVNVTNFSTDSNLPPYITAIFGKRANFNPQYVQTSSRWYVNTDAITPTDPWPVGGVDLVETEAITATSSPMAAGDVVRLRVNATVSNVTSPAAEQFILQYGAADVCTDVVTWTAVGTTTSSEVWRGYDNGSVSDGATIPSTLLTDSDTAETYEENGSTAGTPNAISVNGVGEWDFVLEQNGALAGTNYCFRMVKADTSPFLAYTSYAQVRTNDAPATTTTSALFDNEAAATTTPTFSFFSTDSDGEDIQYELTIDDSYDFSSPVLTKDSSNFPTDAGWSAATFSSGATTSYTIQPADALTSGTTYYWRVRAKDSSGSNEWSVYSTTSSFTINTALQKSGWHQTLGHQFGQGSLSNLSTTTNGVSLAAVSGTVSTTTDSFESVGDNSTNFSSTVLWKQASISTDNGDWEGETGATGSGGTGPNEASDGTVFIYTEASGGGECDNTVGGASCMIEADIEDGTLDSIRFDYHMFGGSIGTLSLEVYDGASWTSVWSASGQQSVNETDWQDSGLLDLSAYKATTQALRFNSAGNGAGFDADVALDNIRVATSTGAVGTIMSPAVDFGLVPNEADWGAIGWTTTEPSGTDTLLRVYYTNVTACDTIVPDGVLPGNGAGYDATDVPLIISGLSTTTYNQLCLQMTLDLGSGASSPTLNSWSIDWDVPNQVPMTPQLVDIPAFDYLLADTTPTLGGFVASDYESEAIAYEITIDDSYDFSSPVLTKDSSNFPTDAGWSAATFSSGATTSYTIQPADALTSGTTYYWRVRAKDPSGTDTWSQVSEVWSFTIDSSVTQIGWHQTLGYQFAENTLSNVSTTTDGAVLTVIGSIVSTTTDSFESVGDNSTNFASTNLWKQASISTDAGDWEGETGATASGGTGPDEASDGTVFVYTESSGGGQCPNTAGVTDCMIEADIVDGTLDSIRFDYHMFGGSIGTLSLDVYDGASWTSVWSASGQQSADETDWQDSGLLDLSAYKETTQALRFYSAGAGTGFDADVALDNIRVATSTLTTGTIRSPEIVFDNIPAEDSWGVIEWNTTEPSGSLTDLRVYYTNVTACDTIVPDSAIPGNAAGFSADQSPLIIDTISTSTYGELCLQMTLNPGSSETSPSLDDWSVKWVVPNQVPYTPTLAETPAFDNQKSTTTTPTLGGFTADDYENESLEFEITIYDTADLSSPVLTKQSSDYPTDAGWSATTFAPNATTTYVVQSGDALTEGETYYWRVRARDPSGTNTWSNYSLAKSITISTAVSVPEWFQTTGAQFGTNTALSNAATTSGSLTIGGADTAITVLDSWTTGATKTVSEGNNRLLVVSVISEDSGLNSNVDTVTYGGQTLTQIEDQQIGTGFSNGMWVGYLDEDGIQAAVGTTITPTWVGTAPNNGLLYSSAVFTNVNQNTPVRGSSPNALTSGTNITPAAAIDVFAGDMVFYVTESTVGVTHTAATNYTEGSEETTGGGGFTVASAYRAITADSSEYPEAQWSGSGNRLLMVSAALVPSAAAATVMSSEVDFDWVPNQTDWGEVVWHVTEPTGSETLTRVYYTNATACDTIVPDGALTGNSAGFISGGSPLDISGLSTSTYNRICLEMTLSKGTAATLPTLDDWAISWERTSVYEQTGYWWYANSNAITPTDTWPVGSTGSELVENEAINSTVSTEAGDILRLRMGVGVTSVDATGGQFKLQYAAGSVCSSALEWHDVAPISSTTALWRGYNNAAVSDGATLPSAVLSNTDVLATYEEENNSATIPSTISIGEYGEWDWVLENQADSGTNYCFRMVTSDGNRFKTYTNYPTLVTNQSPSIASIDTPFDNEQLADATPAFEFTAVDPEGNPVDYQVRISTDATFSSVDVDHNSVDDFAYFNNLVTVSDKSPFNESEVIRYVTPTTLTEGETYWWQVRAVDSENSTNYGEWSTARSFTINSSTTLTTWFQTTEEQFNTNTLTGVVATASDWVEFAPASSAGTTTSSVIDFDYVTNGNAWGTFSFNETGGTNDILYHIEYNTGSGWELIPDTALSDNAAGFDTSPVDIIDLDTETYNQIRIRANFESGSPTLTDWTVTWGERVSVPTHLLLFDNEKVGTTTPTFTFFSSDPQDDDLEYEISWSTDYTFVTGSTTVNSSSSGAFVNTENGGDTSPFTAEEVIRYTMQSELTDGETYWWRVRARDPNGGGSYSFWSNPWSFTVDVTATTSTWFQTTGDQFNTDTLVSLQATSTGSISTTPSAVTTYTFSGMTNPSSVHVARDFEIDVNDPTDPPTVDAIDTITVLGTNASTPNLRSGIAGYASDAEATTGQYTSLAASDNNRWTITDPGAGDNAVFWAEFDIDEDPSNISQIDVLLEGYQAAATDSAWLGIWRPGTTTPYWRELDRGQNTSDTNYVGSITSNIDEYFDGDNKLHIIFFNEDDSDSLFVDYVEVVITSDTATEGTITGTSLDFDDGSGPAWGWMSWTDVEPAASQIAYQVEYLNGIGEWELIPDTDLSGNSTGFTTSPLDLKLLNTTTYNEIRPVGTLTCDGLTCPSLEDWTIEWSRGFTVSGTAYEYDGITPLTSGQVAVAVNGELQTGKTGNISGGSWTIDNVSYFVDDIVTVFIEGAADANEAVAVTKYDGTPDIDGMRLQERHITIGSNDSAIITNTDLGLYDTTQDEDLFFDVNGSNVLTTCGDVGCTDAGIVVLSGNTYAPGANVTTHDFVNSGTFTSGATTVRVSGSWTNTATSTLTGSTVIFTATTSSETIDQTGATTAAFNNLTFGEGSGSATWNISSPLDVNGALSVQYGTVARANETIAVAGSLSIGAGGYWTGIGTTTFDGVNPSNWTDSNASKQNIGNVVVDGASKVLVAQSEVSAESMTIGTNDIFDLNNQTVSIAQSWYNANSFIPRLGTVSFIATTSGQTITAGASSFYNLVFNGASGGWSFTQPTLTVTNDFTIATGTVSLPTSTLSIGGSFDATGGAFAHNNGELRFTGSGTETITFDGGSFTNVVHNLTFTGSGSWTITDTNATSTNDVTVSGGTLVMPSGVLAIGGTLEDLGGAITANSGALVFYSSVSEVLTVGGSTLHTVIFTGSGDWSFTDTDIAMTGDLLVTLGSLQLPAGVTSIGGSYSNTSTVDPNAGTLRFNSTDTGETIDAGNSALYNIDFDSETGGWTIVAPATTTNNAAITSASDWTLNAGHVLSVGGQFSNLVGGASTTWTGATLSLETGGYSLNTKSAAGDTYDTLRVAAGAHVALWNSDALTYTIAATGSLYSQDHAGSDGELYIFGNYSKTTGTDYWSYATDFDGVALATSSRPVTVYFADGANASFIDSALEIRGSSTASTTIQNQGVGTYTIDVTDGTTTAQYYDFVDLGSTGVSLLGGTIVPLLRDGSFTAASNGGTALTLSSTTIDANPAKQIFNVAFATSSAISANNVTQTDGAPVSYWWFRTGTGNLYGEAYDNDTGDPGSVRFDDSSLSITVSGVVYSDAGSTPIVGGTCDGVTPVVRIMVNGVESAAVSCSNVDGSYSASGVTIVGDPTISVYLNDASGGEQGSVITRTPTADITGLDIYANRVILRNEDTEALTINNLAVFDGSADTDMLFTATTTPSASLTLTAGTELFVSASSTFAPAGNVTVPGTGAATSYDGSLYLDDTAAFIGAGTDVYSFGGQFILDTNATFTAASSSVFMTATAASKTITAADTITFNDLSFTGVSGGWNLTTDVVVLGDMTVSAGTVSGTGDITLPSGSLTGAGVVTMSAGTTTVAATNTFGGSTAWTFYNLQFGDGVSLGTTTPSGVATTTVLNQFSIASAHYLDAGASLWNLAGTGTVFIEDGTFIADTSTIQYSGGGADVLSTQYYNLALQAATGPATYTATGAGIIVDGTLTIGGTADSTFDITANDPALDVNGDIAIAADGTLEASNLGDFTLAGDLTNDGTFVGNGGLLTLDTAAASDIAAGSSGFSNIRIDATGDVTFSEHATTSNNFVLANANAFTVDSGQTLAVGGQYYTTEVDAVTTWTGSTLHLFGGNNYAINTATTTDLYGTLSVAANTQIRMWNSDAAAFVVDATGSLYSQDHSAVDGELYIWGAYSKSAGADYWSYATDFDGTALGGSARKVDVYFASGSSAVYTGGQLSVVGLSSASTTIQNQGSGTYSLTIGGTASSTLRYYEMRDMDSTGLNLTGTPTIATLSNGDFEVSQTDGSAITVAGSVITQNPAKNFTQNRFALNGAVSGFNVTATGSTVSSWRFANHSGGLDGEAFDVDPDGDPGYIAWDDSAALITVSGSVYSDEGSTVSSVCDGATNNVTLRVAGITTYSTNCNAVTGLFSISNVAYNSSDSLVVYIDGEVVSGATVSKQPISNINNLHIYEDRVIVRHESANPITIADMADWDSSDDSDIPFTAVTAATNTLDLPADTKLIVWNSKTFTPSGNVTVAGGGTGDSVDGSFEVYPSGQFIATGNEMHEINGDFIFDAGASFTSAQSTLIFSSTAGSRTIDTNESAFYNVSFTGSGSWTITDATATVVADFAKSAGALTLPTGTTTVGGNFENTGGTFDANGGSLLLTAADAGNTITFGSSAAGEVAVIGGGTYTMSDTNATIGGSFNVSDGVVTLPSGTLTVGGSFVFATTSSFTHNSGVVALTSTGTELITVSGSDLHSLTVAGSGDFTMTDASVALRGSLTVASGTLHSATNTMAIAGSLTATGGVLDMASSTVLFDSTDTGEVVDVGTNAFYHVVINSVSGGWTFASATTTGNFSLTAANVFTLGSGEILYVNGVFTNAVGGAATTWTGSTVVLGGATQYEVSGKAVSVESYETLVLENNTDVRFWNSSFATTSVSASSSLYSQDHAGVDGALTIAGDFTIASSTEYWSYATDFDGTTLSGGARRAAQVTFDDTTAAGLTMSGGTLNIVGEAGFETDITALTAAGTHYFVVSGGTLHSLYYSFDQLNSSGLTINSTPVISSLSYGSFTQGVSSGALITLNRTALNANAGLVIAGAAFADGGFTPGNNVVLSATSTNAWQFSGHTGNLAGEDYDVDGVDACGSIRWDDSDCQLLQQSTYRWRNDDGGLGAPASEWFDVSWDARKRVRVVNSDAATYTDAAVQLFVTYDTDMQADFDDLRFTDSTGVTEIPHWIGSSTDSSLAEVWVQVPTLPANDAATVFMYYKNPTATTTSSSTQVFSAADDFEDNNISEYSGQTSLFATDASFAFDGEYGLSNAGNEDERATSGGIYRFDQTVSQGETFRVMQYVDTSAGSGDEPCVMFGVQSPGSTNENYAVCLEQFGTDRISLVRDVVDNDSSGTSLDSTPVSYATGWYEIEVAWGTDDTLSAALYDAAGSLVAVATATDSTYTSGGYGFTYWFHNGGWDSVSSRPLLTTEPAVLFGAEQTDGGSTWKAAQETAATYDIGDTARLRLAVENSGLPLTGLDFVLEYAPLGSAPSCAAVSSGDYAAVPPQSSCGSSAICMDTTTGYANFDSTTDLLFGTEGVYVAGEAIESPENTTASFDLATDTYTEFEFAVTPTVNVADDDYCLRVTDNGAELDAYASVAELSLQFAPTVGSVSFNNGTAIDLSVGTTTEVVATTTITDFNGFADIIGATTTFYKSNVAGLADCTPDNNNCYRTTIGSGCSLSSCSGNSCTLSCTADFAFHTDPTASDGGVFWYAYVEAIDSSDITDFNTSIANDVNVLRALGVEDQINYGTLAVNDDTGAYNASTTVSNLGNEAIDISVLGTDLTDDGASTISVSEQKFATSTFTYAACTYCSQLNTSGVPIEVDLVKPTTITPPVTDDLYWGINIPFGTNSTAHSGINTFIATGD